MIIPPPLSSLIDFTKYKDLVKAIEKSNLTDEEKDFLKFSACRHLVFHYGKIADYYANACVEMQELMEDSALVIIDIEDAIAKGYVRLSEDIKNIVESRKNI